jgi:hypothetical protein
LNNFAGSHEFDACDKLINAYNAGDQAKFNEQSIRTIMTSVFPVEVNEKAKIYIRLSNA